MNNNKGFAFVEILIIIIILCVLFFTILPLITNKNTDDNTLNTKDSVDKTSFSINVQNIIASANLTYQMKLINNEMNNDIIIDFDNNKNTDMLNINGVLPNGILIIQKDGVIKIALNDKNYCALNTDNILTIIDYNEEFCKID